MSKYVVGTYAKGEGLNLRVIEAVSGPEAVGLACLEAIENAPIDALNLVEIESTPMRGDSPIEGVPVKRPSPEDVAKENTELRELVTKLMAKRAAEKASSGCPASVEESEESEKFEEIKAVEHNPGEHTLVKGKFQWNAESRVWTAFGTALSLEEVGAERLRSGAGEYTVVCRSFDGLWMVERKNKDGSLQWWSASKGGFVGESSEKTKWTTRESAALQLKMINALKSVE